MRFVILALSLIVLPACAKPFSADEAVARSQLLQLAPLGSDARQALPKLQSKGFHCTWQKGALFAGVSGKHDFLYCDLENNVGILMTRRWQLALIHEHFAVTDARFGIG